MMSSGVPASSSTTMSQGSMVSAKRRQVSFVRTGRCRLFTIKCGNSSAVDVQWDLAAYQEIMPVGRSLHPDRDAYEIKDYFAIL